MPTPEHRCATSTALRACGCALLVVIAACATSGSSKPGETGAGEGGTGGGGYSTFGDADGGSSGDACQHFALSFVPKIPLVYVLVDRSGSMFDSNAWDPLRTGALTVIKDLETQISFGFGAFTGQAGATCPVLDEVPLALNNYSAIAAKYGALGAPAFKAETPTAAAAELAGNALEQAAAKQAGAGGKYILFVTDGEPDFCDDGNAVCPVDSVVAAFQKLSSEGIGTLVFGVKSALSNISDEALQEFANAGAGIAPVAPAGLTPSGVYDQCVGVAGWSALFTARGLPPHTALGAYGTPGTNAQVFRPDPTDQSALTALIAKALQGVKSCSFDLQGKIKIDVANASRGHVTIDGESVPFDPGNGWTMASDTQLDLVGDACQKWREGGTTIDFDFPCAVVIR